MLSRGSDGNPSPGNAPAPTGRIHLWGRERGNGRLPVRRRFPAIPTGMDYCLTSSPCITVGLGLLRHTRQGTTEAGRLLRGRSLAKQPVRTHERGPRPNRAALPASTPTTNLGPAPASWAGPGRAHRCGQLFHQRRLSLGWQQIPPNSILDGKTSKLSEKQARASLP